MPMLDFLERQRIRPRPRTLLLSPLSSAPEVRRSPAVRRAPVDRRARRGRSLLGRRLPEYPSEATPGRPRDRARPVRRSAARPLRPAAPAAAGKRPGLRLKGVPLEAVLLAAIVAVTLAFLWSRQTVHREPLRLPADAAGMARAYEARLAGSPAAEEPEPPLQESGSPPPPNRLPPRVLESLKVVPYEVKPGDTISTIAGRFSLNLDTLLSYNNIRDVRRLTAGKVLQVPNSNGLKHRVSRGESLGGIAGRYGIALNNLLDWNNLESSVIQPGQELFIPGGRLPATEIDRILGKLFIYPTKGRLSSSFGERLDPFTSIRRFHNGFDIANNPGTPVVSAMAGRVAMVGYNANYGKYIILSHADGYQTLYGHLSEFLVRRSQAVAQGQAIGRMGNTGYSTGPHLHFSIFQRGEPVNPSRFLH